MMKDIKKDSSKGHHHSGSKGHYHQQVDDLDNMADDEYLHCHHDMTLIQLEFQLVSDDRQTDTFI